MISGDVVHEIAEITKIHVFEFLSGNIILSILQKGSEVTYNEMRNDELSKVTSILKK